MEVICDRENDSVSMNDHTLKITCSHGDGNLLESEKIMNHVLYGRSERMVLC